MLLLRAEGTGRVVVGSYGALIRYELQPGELRKIDNGFVVAWSASMPMPRLALASGRIGTSFLSGEGMCFEFRGPGTIICQTRSLGQLAHHLQPYLVGQGSASSTS